MGRTEIINCRIVSEKSIVITLQAGERVNYYEKDCHTRENGYPEYIQETGLPFLTGMTTNIFSKAWLVLYPNSDEKNIDDTLELNQERGGEIFPLSAIKAGILNKTAETFRYLYNNY